MLQKEIIPLLKLLLDADRLLILGLLIQSPADLARLSQQSQLKPATLMRHLGQLEAAGLVEKEAHNTYQFNINTLNSHKKAIFALIDYEDDLDDETRQLQNFVDLERGQIKHMPNKHDNLLLVLHWLAEKFEPDKRYPEKTVNDIITPHHPDYALWRRFLVDYGLMKRDKGIYWRV